MPELSPFEIDHADFEFVRSVVHKHCGISLSGEKQALVQARITKQMRSGGFTSAKQYLKCATLDHNSKMFSDLIDVISTNLTSFFRENQHFEYLTDSIIPKLIERKKASGDQRFLGWSAACSSGEEPYSMAITLLEALSRQKSGVDSWDIRVLATDISTRMLEAAQHGVYRETDVKSVSPALRQKYFEGLSIDAAGQARVVINPILKSIVRFRHLNLIDHWPFNGKFDFIFCRNVMIYFDKATQEKLIGRFWDCLPPGGILFTGHSESLTGISHRFENRRPSIYQKPE